MNEHEAHMTAKRKLKGITHRSNFEDILREAMLSDEEKKIMRMYYIEKKNFAYIADEMGFSEAGIIKKHKKILKIIAQLI